MSFQKREQSHYVPYLCNIADIPETDSLLKTKIINENVVVLGEHHSETNQMVLQV